MCERSITNAPATLCGRARSLDVLERDEGQWKPAVAGLPGAGRERVSACRPAEALAHGLGRTDLRAITNGSHIGLSELSTRGGAVGMGLTGGLPGHNRR